jgi:hypothetical protein
LFRTAIAIHFGGVYQGHALRDAGLQGAELGRLVGISHAHLPGAKAKGRDFFAARKLNVFHCFKPSGDRRLGQGMATGLASAPKKATGSSDGRRADIDRR